MAAAAGARLVIITDQLLLGDRSKRTGGSCAAVEPIWVSWAHAGDLLCLQASGECLTRLSGAYMHLHLVSWDTAAQAASNTNSL